MRNGKLSKTTTSFEIRIYENVLFKIFVEEIFASVILLSLGMAGFSRRMNEACHPRSENTTGHDETQAQVSGR